MIQLFDWIFNGGMSFLCDAILQAGSWLRADHKAHVEPWSWDL